MDTFRRGCNRRWELARISSAVIRQQMGHATTDMTALYTGEIPVEQVTKHFQLEPNGAAAAPYELGLAAGLYPVYVRSEAYLAAHQGGEAAAEFQKILDHRGIIMNSPIGALAHLQIGRALKSQVTDFPEADNRRQVSDFVRGPADLVVVDAR
jgi:hypothetical protein